MRVFKPEFDIRYGTKKLSHTIQETYAIPVKKSHDIITTSKSSDIIAIDEAQFFDEDIIKFVKVLFKENW